eukprot:1701975-Ditylum_brightwellii.AAC.1
MMHKPRHLSAHKWIARITTLNAYITELSTPPRVVSRKMDREKILEVQENGVPTMWKFQMDKR